MALEVGGQSKNSGNLEMQNKSLVIISCGPPSTMVRVRDDKDFYNHDKSEFALLNNPSDGLYRYR